jgi:DNA-binding PadR family transcriptional regulator
MSKVNSIKGLIDMIILRYSEQEEMQGYQLITKMRADFGVSLGPSSVYSLLWLIEKKGYIKSALSMNSERPRKVYQISDQGKSFLSASENTLKMVCQNLIQIQSINKQKILAPSLSLQKNEAFLQPQRPHTVEQ